MKADAELLELGPTGHVSRLEKLLSISVAHKYINRY